MSQGSGSFIVTNTGTGIISGTVAMVPGTAVAYFDGTHGSKPLGPGESTLPVQIGNAIPAGVQWRYRFTRNGGNYAGQKGCSYTPGSVPVHISLSDSQITITQSVDGSCTAGLASTTGIVEKSAVGNAGSRTAAPTIDRDTVLGAILEVSSYLQASEYQLIELMVENGVWTGSYSNPGGQGAIEWGLVPYWIHNPPSFITDFLNGSSVWSEVATWIWKGLEFLVPTQFDSTNYNALITAAEGGGLVEDDGSLVGTGTYEVLDPGWLWSVLNYLITAGDPDVIAPFGTTPAAPIALAGGTSGSVTIAIVGDWGTGSFTNGQAIEVMNGITALSPDYLIHLGDVYYSGTTGDFPPLDEEQGNFLNNLPAMSAGTCFTLNSNHEMYAGGTGYFNVALADSRFSAQNNTSYFALQYGGWTIIGLDSAYNATSMYMNGALDNAGVQASWIGGLGVSADEVIVLTHHSPLNYDGTADPSVPLWGQVNAALGGADPAAWYWGHIHNGIAYTPSGIGKSTLARCVGHGAIPFGNATGLENLSSDIIEYYAHTPNSANPPTVMNGFVLLTITSQGEVTEEFYEANNSSPVYTNTYNLPAAVGQDKVEMAEKSV